MSKITAAGTGIALGAGLALVMTPPFTLVGVFALAAGGIGTGIGIKNLMAGSAEDRARHKAAEDAMLAKAMEAYDRPAGPNAGTGKFQV